SLHGAIQFLDELGGVDVFVENPMHYEDHTAKLLIDLKPGMQHLDGKTAVGFARFRHDAMGDIGRVARQQALLHSVEQKLVNPINWWRLPKLASAAGQLFNSDFAAGDYASLASFAKNRPAVSYTTLPGDFGYHGYWIPNHSRIASLMESLNNDRESAPKAGGGAPVSVEVLYGAKQENAATKLAGLLGERGLMVVRTAPLTPNMSTATRVIGRNGNPHQNPVLTSLMPQAAWQLSDDESPYSADYTVVIGPDYK
ncbi:MAG TPA: LCP family protein, partial [Stenomitos sp.]